MDTRFSKSAIFELWVKETLTADVTDKRFAKGRVAIQHHGKGGLRRFRNGRM